MRTGIPTPEINSTAPHGHHRVAHMSTGYGPRGHAAHNQQRTRAGFTQPYGQRALTMLTILVDVTDVVHHHDQAGEQASRHSTQ